MSVDPATERLLRRGYEAFNARDVDVALSIMHPDVDWPNVVEDTRVHGHAAVREYWLRQFEVIDSRVQPRRFDVLPDGRVAVAVHQVVRDRAGHLLSDGTVQHVYVLADGLVRRMDVTPAKLDE